MLNFSGFQITLAIDISFDHVPFRYVHLKNSQQPMPMKNALKKDEIFLYFPLKHVN